MERSQKIFSKHHCHVIVVLPWSYSRCRLTDAYLLDEMRCHTKEHMGMAHRLHLIKHIQPFFQHKGSLICIGQVSSDTFPGNFHKSIHSPRFVIMSNLCDEISSFA
jgi:hypothetical protein